MQRDDDEGMDRVRDVLEGGGEEEKRVPVGDEAAACPHHLTPISARYEVARVLRDTIYGKVMLAVSRASGRAVAVKVSNVNAFLAAAGGGRAENPAEEARVMRALSRARGGRGHPRVVRLLETAECAGAFATVLELCAGGELFDAVARGGRLQDRAAARLARHCARALRFMHAQGWMHLDVKPENILLDAPGAGAGAKICDFGVARPRLPAGQLYPGARGRPGTVAYMAPEVYAMQPFDHSADVFSLGAAFFVAAVGSPPYERPCPTDKRFRLIHEGRLAELLTRWGVRAAVSDAAVDAIQRMMLPRESRITVEELLVHPWLAQVVEEGEAAEDADLDAP